MRMIDADALLTEIRKKEAEPNYQHTGEDWCVGLIIAEGLVDEQPTIEPQKWIPVSQELPEDGKVVIAIGKKGTWDVGTYRGFLGDNIHRWQWKKNTIKTVYWWMYKENALPEPYKGDNNAD